MRVGTQLWVYHRWVGNKKDELGVVNPPAQQTIIHLLSHGLILFSSAAAECLNLLPFSCQMGSPN